MEFKINNLNKDKEKDSLNKSNKSLTDLFNKYNEIHKRNIILLSKIKRELPINQVIQNYINNKHYDYNLKYILEDFSKNFNNKDLNDLIENINSILNLKIEIEFLARNKIYRFIKNIIGNQIKEVNSIIQKANIQKNNLKEKYDPNFERDLFNSLKKLTQLLNLFIDYNYSKHLKYLDTYKFEIIKIFQEVYKIIKITNQLSYKFFMYKQDVYKTIYNLSLSYKHIVVNNSKFFGIES